jgi:hypothetical protein
MVASNRSFGVTPIRSAGDKPNKRIRSINLKSATISRKFPRVILQLEPMHGYKYPHIVSRVIPTGSIGHASEKNDGTISPTR